MVSLEISRYADYDVGMTKTCKVCGATDQSAEFYASFKSRCKDCHKMLVRQNRKDKIEYYRAYDAERYQKDNRVRERHKRYQQTEAGKLSMMKARKKWKEKSPEKRAAHIILNNEVKKGVVQKPDNCSICGATGRIHGHHEDYTKPLDVIWCCALCHAQFHKDKT